MPYMNLYTKGQRQDSSSGLPLNLDLFHSLMLPSAKFQYSHFNYIAVSESDAHFITCFSG